MSELIKKDYCDSCNDKQWNRKHKGVYDDHTYCFRCHEWNQKGQESAIVCKEPEVFIGNYEDLPERGISREVCELLGIMKGKIYNKDNCYAYLYDNGTKIRLPDKSFPWIDGSSDSTMFGLDQAIDYNKPIIITEGEFDTAACYEVGYQACSVTLGAGSIEKCLSRDYDKLFNYPEIWLGLDNDQAGREALEKAVKLLPIEKIKVIQWQNVKDANEALLKFHDSPYPGFWEYGKVTDYVPKGLLLSSQINIEELRTTNVKSIKLPLPKLQESMGGLDYGCNYGILAGVGIGKTTLLTHLNLKIFLENPNIKIASLFYEEGAAVTPKRYIAALNYIPVGKLRRNGELLTKEQWETTANSIYSSDRMAFLNKDADRTSKGLLEYMKWLVKVRKFDLIVIDHISYIIGRSGVSKHGERRDIDELIYQIQDLTNQLNCITMFISHITESKDEKKNWDDGKVPSLYSGRGSKALAQIPDGIIGIARNMKDENSKPKSICDIYCLKSRWDGKLGKCDSLIYLEDTGIFQEN